MQYQCSKAGSHNKVFTTKKIRRFLVTFAMPRKRCKHIKVGAMLRCWGVRGNEVVPDMKMPATGGTVIRAAIARDDSSTHKCVKTYNLSHVVISVLNTLANCLGSTCQCRGVTGQTLGWLPRGRPRRIFQWRFLGCLNSVCFRMRAVRVRPLCIMSTKKEFNKASVA